MPGLPVVKLHNKDGSRPPWSTTVGRDFSRPCVCNATSATHGSSCVTRDWESRAPCVFWPLAATEAPLDHGHLRIDPHVWRWAVAEGGIEVVGASARRALPEHPSSPWVERHEQTGTTREPSPLEKALRWFRPTTRAGSRLVGDAQNRTTTARAPLRQGPPHAASLWSALS